MNAHELVDVLQMSLEEHVCADEISRIVTYEQAEVLTRHAGLVVRTESGDEFHVTVVQVRHCWDDSAEDES